MVDKVKEKAVGEARAVFEAVHAIMHLFRAEQYRAFRDGPLELTHMEGRLLGFLARRGEATLTELAAHMERDKGQLARLIKNLKAAGLIEGAGDERDRRSVRLGLTARGHEVHDYLRRRVDRLAARALDGMNAGERASLAALLERMRGNLGVAAADAEA